MDVINLKGWLCEVSGLTETGAGIVELPGKQAGGKRRKQT
jgi:hypothetical protein